MQPPRHSGEEARVPSARPECFHELQREDDRHAHQALAGDQAARHRHRVGLRGLGAGS